MASRMPFATLTQADLLNLAEVLDERVMLNGTEQYWRNLSERLRALAASPPSQPEGLEDRVRAVLDHIEHVWVNCRDHHAPLAGAGGDPLRAHEYEAKSRQAYDLARRLREALGDGPPQEPDRGE